MTNVPDIIKKCSPWMRISICINIHVKKALINVLHNHINDPQVQKLPSDPTDLYAFFQANKKIIQKSKFIKEHQKLILLPALGQTVDSSSFDISLTRFLIQTFNGIWNARGDWKEPDSTDVTLCAYVYRAAALRNATFHDDNIEGMNATDFEKKWKQLEEILKGLKYVEDMEPFKTETLVFEKCEKVILQEFVDHLKSYKEECLNNKLSQDNYILRRFSVDGNKNDIITESDLEVLLQNNDCVMINGEAGIGKSSLAKRLKNEWSAKKVFDNHNIIYYDSKKINKQLAIQSNAAALYHSEMGDHLKKKGRTIDDLSIYNCVKTNIENLIIVIDGVDEFTVKELVNGGYVDELETKIINNKEITGIDTISAIYFGFFYPYSKIILLGRIGEFESLKKVKVKGKAAIFNRKTKDLELLKFDDANIKDLSCFKICKKASGQSICTNACKEIYAKIKDIELCKNPTDLNSLLELHKTHPNKNIGNITRTKLIIATLFNRLTNHIKQKNNFIIKRFDEINEKNEFRKYLECFRILGEVSLKSLLKGNVTIQVKKIRDSNSVVYFEDENQISIERETFEELDLFYVRDLNYYYILEPHHTLNLEFLCACYLFSHPDKWDSILELSVDRRLVIILFIAGLHADDYFTKDFVENVFNTSSYSLEQFFKWLYNVENVRYRLPDGGRYYKSWFGLMQNQKLSPSLFLLNSISKEVEIPPTFIPKIIVYYIDYSNFFEWYYMNYFEHNFLTKLSDKLNIELFSKKFPSFEFIIKGNIEINNKDEFNQLNQCGANNLITFRIDTLYIDTSLETWFNFNFNVNRLDIGWKCDSRTIDLILIALSPSPASTSSSNVQPTLKCKQFHIYNIQHFNSQQTEKLFTLCLSGVVDYILLRDTFFTDKQLAILKDVERKTHTKINIEFCIILYCNQMFGLPNIGNRHVGLRNLYVTDNHLIKLSKEHIPTGYENNFDNYKIIYSNVPFVRKENSSQNCNHSMFLNLSSVDLKNVSPAVFAKTFSMISSLSCADDDERIPSSHWLRLSQTDDCRLNEMRIWNPQSENFKHFLDIKTRVSQFICYSKHRLKQLLDYIVEHQNIQFDKQINVFVVKFDRYNWNYYDEMTLFGRKTIKAYKDNCSSDNLLLDNFSVPFHEGKQHLKWWCCEISNHEKYNLRIESSSYDNFVEGIQNKLNESSIIDYTEIEDNITENQDNSNSNSCLLAKCCCCFLKS